MLFYTCIVLQYFPDRFVRKDVLSLSVSCKFRHKGCDWDGKIKDLKDHLEKCDYGSTQCDLCSKSLHYVDLKSHESDCPHAKRCPLSAIGCEHSKPMSEQDLDEHLDFNKRRHMELVVEKITVLESALFRGALVRVPGVPHRQDDDPGYQSLPGCLSAPAVDLVEKDCASTVPQPLPLKKSNFPNITVRDSYAPLDASQIADRKMLSIFNEELVKVQSSLKTSVQQELKFKDEEIASLKSTVQKLEKAMRSKNADFEDRDFRLSLIENSNYDGTMVWKIPQFGQRMTDARSGKYTSIFSLPFYTGRYGYKMCLRLYILGDGIGKGNYMSLFFVVMKGEFDNILPWPFTHKVTFKLLNQGNGRDIVDTFQPDPMSTSFRKPRSDMNIASGCPRFVSHEDLNSSGFITDDTVFIKCSVDTSTIRHP